MKTNDDRTFMLMLKIYPLKLFVLEEMYQFYPLNLFVPEEMYIGELSKVFWDSHSEKKMGISFNPDEKNKNWREKKKDIITLKAAVNKADTKS